MHDEIIQTLRQVEREFGCRDMETLNGMMRSWVGEAAVSVVRGGTVAS